MTKPTLHAKILLGVCGSIAAYKAAYLARLFIKAGCEVRVVMTDAAHEFVGEATFQAITDYPVRSKVFDSGQEQTMDHITLARWSDITLIAPATANTIAQIAHGRGENLLSTLALATTQPILFAPAMNPQMWQNPATQENVALLNARGMSFINPGSGDHACGELGEGRMAEPQEIADFVFEYLNTHETTRQTLAGKNVVITAGPTEESIDPVRVITNHSSGKMGYALAQVASELGANVTLVSGPVHINSPQNVQLIKVKSALQMHEAVMRELNDCDIFIGTAAVADYRPAEEQTQKIKKENSEQLTLTLVKNPDIITDVAESENRPFVVGFAAETNDVLEHASSKLSRKKLDMICANDVSAGQVFGSNVNQITIIDKNGDHKLALTSKVQAARSIFNHIASLI